MNPVNRLFSIFSTALCSFFLTLLQPPIELLQLLYLLHPFLLIPSSHFLLLYPQPPPGLTHQPFFNLPPTILRFSPIEEGRAASKSPH